MTHRLLRANLSLNVSISDSIEEDETFSLFIIVGNILIRQSVEKCKNELVMHGGKGLMARTS